MPTRRYTNRQMSRTLKTPDVTTTNTPVNNSTKKTLADLKSDLPLLFYAAITKRRNWFTDEIVFEGTFYIYTLTALICQFVYIYKTVWWYPEKLPPSETAVNFHLVDYSLVYFLLQLFAVCPARTIIQDNMPVRYHLWTVVIFIFSVLWLIEIVKNITRLYQISGFIQFLSLCYPPISFIIYEIIYKNSWFHHIKRWIFKTNKNTKNSNIINYWMKVQSHYESLIKPDNNEFPNQDPDKIREYVDALSSDYNVRMMEIIFRTFFCTYYAGLVPIFFTSKHQYFDFAWCIKHTVLICFNSALMLTTHLFSCEYLEVLSKTCLLLGNFELYSLDIPKENKEWSNTTIYLKNDIVSYNNKYYIATCEYNVVEPGNLTHKNFFKTFHNPIYFATYPLVVVICTTFYQLFLLFTNSTWDRFLCQVLLLFFNYTFLFCTLKDRIILGKERHRNASLCRKLSTLIHKSKSE